MILSDNELDDRLKACLALLTDATGETVHGNTALKAARKALQMLSFALIAAAAQKENPDEYGPDDPLGFIIKGNE